MNPIRPRQLDHVVLRVADLERSRRFYQDTLGFPLARANERTGLHQFRVGSSMVDLVPRGDDAATKSGRNMDHFAVTLAEYDEAAIIAWLRSRGVAAHDSRKRFGAEGRGTSILIEDPDGNTIELKGPPD